MSEEGYIRPVTFWVVGDFDKPSGRQLLYDAIRHMVRKSLIFLRRVEKVIKKNSGQYHCDI